MMADLGHTEIDLLKMDIEGAEYDVIQNMLASFPQILPKQILVEFHDDLHPDFSGRSKSVISSLNDNGYSLVHTEGDEHTFVRRTWTSTRKIQLLEGDVALWENDPVKTEFEAYLRLKEIAHDNSDVLYLAYPWAPYLNGAGSIPKIKIPRSFTGEVFTVCQHIRYREILPLLAELGINTLFTPHATKAECVIHGITILPFPHFPLSYSKNDAPKDFLFSFSGTENSTARTTLLKIFGDGKSVKSRNKWHFEQSKEEMEQFQIEYSETMSRSRFTLCPQGTGPSSLRIWEALLSGSVPVIIADDLRLPEGIDWQASSVQIAESEIPRLQSTLEKITPDRYQVLQKGVAAASALLERNFAFPIDFWLASLSFKVWMTKDEIRLIENHLQPTHTVLEWGAGGSSLHFSKFVKSLISIEHSWEWHYKLKKFRPTGTLLLERVDSGTGPGDVSIFSNYIKRPAKLGLQFDRVLIDGRCRVDCAFEILDSNLLSSGGLVFIHDWNRERYHTVLSRYQVITEIRTSDVDQNGLVILRPK